MEALALVLVLFLVALPVYFAPSIVAAHRSHRNLTAIFLLNLFLGWVLVGWVGALVWAVLDGQEARTRYARRGAASAPTPFDDFDPFPAGGSAATAATAAPAATPVPVAASVEYGCPHCGRAAGVPVAYVGGAVTCGTCRRAFTATPPVC